MLSDRIKELRAALEASPSKIVLIVTRDHQDNEPGSKHADKKSSGERGWAHVAIAFLDKDGNPVFAEKTPSKPGLGGLINSPNKSGTEGRLVTKYTTVEIIPIDLTRFGPSARERFHNCTRRGTYPPIFILRRGRSLLFFLRQGS